MKHLFEECDWRPFLSHEAPPPDTWDAEDRGYALVYSAGAEGVKVTEIAPKRGRS